MIKLNLCLIQLKKIHPHNKRNKKKQYSSLDLFQNRKSQQKGKRKLLYQKIIKQVKNSIYLLHNEKVIVSRFQIGCILMKHKIKKIEKGEILTLMNK